MATFRRSVLFSFCDRYAALFLNLITMAVLARLLTPSEVGTYVVVMAIIGVVNTVREFGLPAYLISKPELSEHCIRTAFTITFFSSCAFVVILLPLRGPLADFYGEPALTEGIVVAAASLLLFPVSVTVVALLQRDMAFDAAAVCNLCGALATAVVSVGLAALGAGFMAPIWGALAGTFALTLVCLRLRPQPSLFVPSLREWRSVLAFGGYSSASGAANALLLLAPQLILGRVLDLAAAGLFSRAVMVSQLVDKLMLDAVRPVILPAISARARSGENLKATYLQSLEYISGLHWPFLLFVAFTAEPIVGLMFGSQWLAIVPLVQTLAIASLAMYPVCLTYPILVSLGLMHEVLRASIASVPLSLTIIFGASFFGIQAVAASAFITAPLQFLVAVLFVRRHIPFGIAEFVAAARKSAVVAICAGLGPAVTWVIGGLPGDFWIFDFTVAGLLAVAGWCVGIFITRHRLAGELQRAASHIRMIDPRSALQPRKPPGGRPGSRARAACARGYSSSPTVIGSPTAQSRLPLR